MKSNSNPSYATAPTQFITAANGIQYAYRRLGGKAEGPVFYFNHLAANPGHCDPRITGAMAARYEIISFDYRGVGSTSGDDATSIQAMARDSLAFVKALGYKKKDVMAFSMGGFITQELMAMEPALVQKVVLAGTGPRGGKGISDVVRLTYRDIVKGLFTSVDPKFYLFFTSAQRGKTAARQFLKRIQKRTVNRDSTVKIPSLSAQLSAISKWGHELSADLSKFTLPVLVINGDNDRMVPTPNSYDLAKRTTAYLRRIGTRCHLSIPR